MAGPTDYLHGYSPAEQRRLHAQARVMGPYVHRDLAFPKGGHILEIGCGVGAQTALLLRDHPTIRITAVDRSATQLAAAQRFFKSHPARHRVNFVRGDATGLRFERNTFDGAFICWLLEHVPDPVAILREARRVLKPSATLHLREVFNHTLYLFPRMAGHEAYWRAYNAHQHAIGGNPNVGIELPRLLRAAGFRQFTVLPEQIIFDARTPRLRRLWLDYWRDLMLSGVPSLLAHRSISPALVAKMKRELTALRKNPEAIFYYAPVFAAATK